MRQASHKRSRLSTFNRKLLQIGILIIAAGLSFAALVLPISTRPSYFPIRAGDVAPQDIQAPRALTYTSQVLTEQAREEAVQRVGPIYLPADPAIARQQIEHLRSTLTYISTVRADAYANLEQKEADLAAIEHTQFTQAEAERILSMSDARWQTVQSEALTVLEQVMRSTIREGQVRDFQRSIPTLISFTLPQDQALTVSNLVTPFVVANSLYSEEQTSAARADARSRVEPVLRTYATGEAIVRRGQIINPSTYEALQQFDLIETPSGYRDTLATLALVTLMMGVTTLYFNKRKPPMMESIRGLALVVVTFLIFLFFARLIIPNRAVLPYLYPISAFGLTVASLFSLELGLVLSIVLSILAAFGLPNGFDLTVYYILSSLFGMLILEKGLRIGAFLRAGMGMGAAGAAAILAYRLPDTLTDLMGITTLIGASFFTGLASASLTLILQFLFAQLLGMATALQLLEISRPDHPLQQFLLQNAPGSYQHSLQVSIMAEQAAEKISADALLVRVGAIYHDAGKALNPLFFIENQIPGNLNPHHDLDPAVSAQTIIRHVTDSVGLARKHRLPSRIMDFMREHHGTLVTRYQYAKAIEAAGGDASKVNEDLFRYPGPRPQSRETALLMLADGCQARARAELPQDVEEIRELIRKVIHFCQEEGQLDDTRLTLRDLNLITESFVKTLQNTYHPRIRYPELQPASPPADAGRVETAALNAPETGQPAEPPSESPLQLPANIHEQEETQPERAPEQTRRAPGPASERSL
jgi:putative nucleotidyltransferase with HDIG domain